MVQAVKCLIVYGRGLDINDRQLYLACRELIGKPMLARASNLSSAIRGGKANIWHGSRELTDVDLCFLRSLGTGSLEQVLCRVGVLECMKSCGTFMVNGALEMLLAKNKFLSLCRLALEGFPAPDTYLTESANWAYRMCQDLGRQVYKPLLGSMGFGSQLFRNVDEAYTLYHRLEELGIPIHVQRYVEKRRDLRIFVIDGEVAAAMERVPRAGEWRANVSQGGWVKPFRAEGELGELAIRAVEKLDLFYAGVDLLEVDEAPLLLEVNASPHWQGVQEASGVNIAQTLVKAALRHLKK